MRPKAVAVEPLHDFKLQITFSNNEKRVFDVKPYFKFKPFKELKEPGLFKTVRIAGLSIEWQNGVDICPDELYYDSLPKVSI